MKHTLELCGNRIDGRLWQPMAANGVPSSVVNPWHKVRWTGAGFVGIREAGKGSGRECTLFRTPFRLLDPFSGVRQLGLLLSIWDITRLDAVIFWADAFDAFEEAGEAGGFFEFEVARRR